MLKRLFSSNNVMNKLNATDNRIDDNICGIDGKKFWSLDKTNLIKSEYISKYITTIDLFIITSLPFAILYDYRIVYLSLTSFIISDILSNISRKYEKKYIDNNDISDY